MVPSVHAAAQTLLFLRSMLLGACLMLVYDALRILRMAAPSPGWLVFLEDVGFFAACAVTTFGFLVSANYGEIRAFALLGEALGALLCALTLSQLLMACSRTIIAAVRAVWNVIFRLFLRPCYRVCRWIAGLIVGCVHGCGVKMKKSLHLANFGLKQRRFLLYNLIKSRPRDPPPSGSSTEGEKNGNYSKRYKLSAKNRFQKP